MQGGGVSIYIYIYMGVDQQVLYMEDHWGEPLEEKNDTSHTGQLPMVRTGGPT